MPRYIFVRHGQTEHNLVSKLQGWHDTALTKKGIDDVKAAVLSLPSTFDCIISSDLGRARQTADIIRQSYATLPVYYDWRIRERCYGDMEGKEKDGNEIDRSFENPAVSYRGTEPVNHMDERLKSFLRDTSTLIEAATIVVVTHSGILNRLGYLLEQNLSHHDYTNGSTVQYTIDPLDPRLTAHDTPPWSPSI